MFCPLVPEPTHKHNPKPQDAHLGGPARRHYAHAVAHHAPVRHLVPIARSAAAAAHVLRLEKAGHGLLRRLLDGPLRVQQQLGTVAWVSGLGVGSLRVVSHKAIAYASNIYR